ncbi:hypothetical protein Glove_140g14 [Diversispora epigaea]|uniref:Ubiquitin-like domain-containing protein n=1 Tax=Diversispora epigaea TaxID=1348612 RepID=A0A397IZI7_9GLOM|nr:hypothetical protein Glove_140g14 [Diversispora epigaea]
MQENKVLLLMCLVLCSSFLGLLIFEEIEQWSQYKEFKDIIKIPFFSRPEKDPQKKPKFSNDTVSLIASAISEITKSSVITYYDYLERDPKDTRMYEQLDFNSLYKAYLVGGPVATTKTITYAENYENNTENKLLFFQVIIQNLVDQVELQIEDLNDNTTIYELKKKIQNVQGVKPHLQRLVFNGQELFNINNLEFYNITMDSIIHLEIHLKDDYDTIKYINPDLDINYNEKHHNYHSQHHLDFKNLKVCEWKEIKFITPIRKFYVINEDKDFSVNDDKERIIVEILRNKRKRKWKFSFHGVAKNHHSHSIADDGYLESKKYQKEYQKTHQFNNFSHGIYTTPNIKLASLYAKTFTHNGIKFQMLFQNLVNSETLVKVPIYHKNVEYWVTPSEFDIRLYSILIRKVNSNCM